MSGDRLPPDPTTQQGEWVGARSRPRVRTLAGRYELGETLGAGGSGAVYRAKDLLAGEDVAVKMLLPMSTEQVARVRREIAALRILRLPGVVRFIDEGVDEGEHFIVMELVEGGRFPGEGGDRSWEHVGPRAVRLIEGLALVHSAGVIHRDLKPANVLVDTAGRPHILDFGIARGPALGETITTRTVLLGTPRYLAPEQLTGHPVDVRCDLYSLGVMLFEALAGRPPHPYDSFPELYAARVSHDAPSILHHRPDLPRRVGLVIDRLLARRPEERPRSAAEVLADLGEDGSMGGALPRLPRLGDPTVVPALVDAALAGRPFTLAGARGAGKTRALRDAAEQLTAAGRKVVWLVPGGRPFESLVPAFGDPGGTENPAPWYRARIAAHYADGVLLMDDAGRLDRWSAGLLQALPGPFLRTSATGGDHALRELTEAELAPIFRGPSRLLHLPEDGARELYARAGGLPSRITAEVGAWVAAGLAEWVGGQVLVTRSALERLAGGLPVFVHGFSEGERPPQLDGPLEDVVAWVAMAWPDATRELLQRATGLPAWELQTELEEVIAQGAVRVLPDGRLRAIIPDVRSQWPEERRRAARLAIAAHLPPGTPSRFGHLLGAGDFAGAAAEALLIARSQGRDGRAGLAAGTASVGLSVARVAEEAAVEEELLRELTIDALRSWTVGPCERARYELGRASLRSARVTWWTTILRAALDVWHGRGEAALREVESIPPLDDEEMEVWRMTVRVAAVAAATRGGDTTAVLAAELAWSRASAHRSALHAGWLGIARYRQGRFAEAAALHDRSAVEREDPVGRLSATLNGVAARIDGGRLADAEPLAEAARAQAEALRLAFFEGRAEWARRTIAYRLGRATTPDLALVDAADALEHPALAAQIRLTEAAVAWRAGALDRAGALAEGACRTWTTAGMADPALLAEALALASGAGAPEAVRHLADRARLATAPRLAVQALGLLGWVAPLDRAHVETAEAFAALVPAEAWSHRNEVLAIEEALSYVRAGRSPT